MRKYIYYLIIVYFLFIEIAAASYPSQGFDDIVEGADGGVNFKCSKQCFIVLDKMEYKDYINIKGALDGSGVIGYGFLVGGQQVFPGNVTKISGGTKMDEKMYFSKSQVFGSIPKEANIIVIMEGNVLGSNVNFFINNQSASESIETGLTDAFAYKAYNPRTINFLEWPMWNGKYINEKFFWYIMFLLLIAGIGYFISGGNRKNIYFGIGVLAFFWIMFDVVNTTNEVRIFNGIFANRGDILKNSRSGGMTDFIDYLGFVEKNIPTGKKGFFIAPYPFDFEGKYHGYPEIKFDAIEKSKYLIYYNPYGKSPPFGFKDPVYSSGTLSWDKYRIDVEKEIIWKPYAKIYIVK